jgi:hypothetical protein
MWANPTLLVGFIIGFVVPVGEAAAPPGERGRAGAGIEILAHKLETNSLLSEALKREVPAVLEVVVRNTGRDGDVVVRAEQGDRRWEEQVYLRAGEKGTIRVELPGATSGWVFWYVGVERQVSFSLPGGERHGGWFGVKLLALMLFGGIAAFVMSVVRLRLLRSRPTPSAASPRSSLLGAGGIPVCSICGAALRPGEVAAGLCAPCRRRANG